MPIEKRRTVRPSPTWKDHKLFYLCVFVGISFSVVWWGRGMARPEAPAEVHESVACVHGRGVPATPGSVLVPGEIQQEIASEENLRRVVRELNLANDSDVAGEEATVEQAVARIQRELQVEADPADGASEFVVSITHSAEDPGYSAMVVNAVAERGAQSIRQACRQTTEAAYAAAREAASRAQRELLAAQDAPGCLLRTPFRRPSVRRRDSTATGTRRCVATELATAEAVAHGTDNRQSRLGGVEQPTPSARATTQPVVAGRARRPTPPCESWASTSRS